MNEYSLARSSLEEARTYARQLEEVNAIGRELSAMLELDPLLHRILRAAIELTHSEEGAFFLMEEEDNSLVFSVVEGGPPDLVGMRIPAGTGIVGRVAATGQPLIVNDVQQNPHWLDVVDLSRDHTTRSILAVPLMKGDQCLGVLEVINRVDGQPFHRQDLTGLIALTQQAVVAMETARLHQAEIAKQRMERELSVARLIQQTLLPQDLPALDHWNVTAYYQPAREVGGDFYDFVYFPNGKIGFIVADVTDKGVPAALVMATTRTLLRAAAERLETPGAVLARTNDVLVNDIPPKMFVTCFYAILDPATGHLHYANAGHDLPYRYTANGVEELRARGMPLGLMPGMQYEEKETVLAPGEYVLFYSDGLVEAHDPAGEMFSFPRLQELLATQSDAGKLKEFLLAQLALFTGADWEQEDDVTLVTLQRERQPAGTDAGAVPIAHFTIPSAPGNERQAMEKVADLLRDLLPEKQLERMKTAVAEATMNAMEHGNGYDPEKPVQLHVFHDATAVRITITDSGRGQSQAAAETPDLEAKLTGAQSPRGWGLFLIQNMVDKLHMYPEENSHTIELVMNLG